MEVNTTSMAVISAAIVVGLAVTAGLTIGAPSSTGADDTYGKAISFVAFCAENGVDRGDVSYTVTEDEDGEVQSVSYDVNGSLDTVTYKAGTEINEVDSPANPGTVTTGDGSSNSDLAPQNFCPSGESGVKIEF